MTYPVKTVSADTAIKNAIIILAEQGLYCLPVVRENANLQASFLNQT